jgi:tRNA threonylcarbamoyladenosine biosynthesis protein TsaB
MRILGLETSGAMGGFAVADGGGVASEVFRDVTGRHLEQSVAMLEEALGGAGVRIDDLDGVAVGLGPGSFTGLRVGLALAKGICFGRGLPLVGVGSLDAIAQGLAWWQGIIVPMRDARRGEIYIGVYRSDGSGIERLSQYLALPPEKVMETVRGLPGSPRILVAGDALVRYGPILRSESIDRVTEADPAWWNARPGTVASMGLKLLEQGATLELDSAEPLYVRPSEAEKKAGVLNHNGTGGAADKKNERR